MTTTGNAGETYLDEPQEMQRPSPYGDLPSLHDLYTQVPSNGGQLRHFGSDAFVLGTGRDSAIQNTAPDLPPIPGKHAVIGRDHGYIRHGTVSLLASIDLLSVEVLGLVRTRHRSAELIEFLELADAHYPAGPCIRIVLDNHSAHVSRQRAVFWPRCRTTALGSTWSNRSSAKWPRPCGAESESPRPTS